MDFLGFTFTPSGVLGLLVSGLMVGLASGVAAVALMATVPPRHR